MKSLAFLNMVSFMVLFAYAKVQTVNETSDPEETGTDVSGAFEDTEYASFDPHVRVPTEEKGCYRAFPDGVWQSTECAKNPPQSALPRGFVAHPPAGNQIVFAQGTFATANLTHVTDSSAGAGAYTIQINTNWFRTPSCSDDLNCWGWNQFVYTAQGDSDGFIGIVYFLINYNKDYCPAGYVRLPHRNNSGSDCWTYNDQLAYVDPIPVADLNRIKVIADVTPGAEPLSFYLGAKGSVYGVTAPDLLGLSGNWDSAQLNVVGWGDCSEAQFNTEAAITARLKVYDANQTAYTGVTCTEGYYPCEKSNLTTSACDVTSNQVAYTMTYGG